MAIDLDSIRQRNDERKRLKAAATDGPWDNVHLARDNAGPAYCGPASAPVLWAHWVNMNGNILFAVHARNDPVEADVDALLARIEELESELRASDQDVAHLEALTPPFPFAGTPERTTSRQLPRSSPSG